MITHYINYIMHIRYKRGIPCNPYSRMKKCMVHQFQDFFVDCGFDGTGGPQYGPTCAPQDPEMYSGLDDGVDPQVAMRP